jgi:4,5-dihydroxyphthalate decarboxylase
MADLALTLMARAYDRLLPLRTGDVKPRGIQLAFVPGMPADILDRIARGEVDLGETSMGQYTLRRSRDVDDVVALPIFPLRMFRQGDAYVRRTRELTDLAQLRGKRVGLEGYGKSSNVWTRGILQHEYGVAPTEIEWFEGRTDPHQSARLTPPGDVPPGIRLTAIGDDQSLSGLLLAGELDVILPSWPPSDYRPDGGIERLYPDYPREDRRYYQKTGLWPIQHTIAIRRQVVEECPWVVESLVTAFDQATDFWKALLAEHHSIFPWAPRELTELEHFFGEDFYRNGLVGHNRRNVEVFTGYAHEQGMAARPVSLEEFFPAGV